jgi:hypothetical protein
MEVVGRVLALQVGGDGHGASARRLG